MPISDPLCQECGDDGRRTLDPAHRGGPARVGAECEACPRCAVCECRLAGSRRDAIQLEGWDAVCGLSHLVEAMGHRTAAERALCALDLLEQPPLEQQDLADLLRTARSWLSDFTRALLSVGGAASAEVDSGTLRSLAGVDAAVPVVTEMCVECDRVAARRLDFSGAGCDSAVWSLCDTHARLEAEVVRRIQRHAVRELAEADSWDAPQLVLPLRPGIKKVRHSLADHSRASG